MYFPHYLSYQHENNNNNHDFEYVCLLPYNGRINYPLHRDTEVYGMEFVRLTPQHDDIVTDIAFDYYGTRFATCSIDLHIKIWTLVNSPTPGNGSETNESNHGDNSGGSPSWVCHDIPGAHDNSIWRLSWSHPEYGPLLASCSEDGYVKIWIEQEYLSTKTPRKIWNCKIFLGDKSQRAVNDVKFAPRHLELKLATASADGTVKIYEPTDALSLSYWNQQVK